MFQARLQSFDDATEPASSRARLDALRGELRARGLSALIIPTNDRHQSEYVPPSERRLAWLTGFTGSAGTAVVLEGRAVLFTDGRYTLQAGRQLDPELFELVDSGQKSVSAWLEENLTADMRLGFDPWLYSIEQTERLQKACAAAGAALVATEEDIFDAVWRDRPPPPLGPVSLHDIRFAGESAASKIERVQAELGYARADALVVSEGTEIAWLFNIRGSDIAHTPLPLAFAIVRAKSRPSLFIDGRKLDNVVRSALEEFADIAAPEEFARELGELGAERRTTKIDPANNSVAIANIIEKWGGRVSPGPDPITLMKACKNETEIAGARAAHLRDGAAMARFLAWFEREAAGGQLTEIDAVTALEDFRRATGKLKDISFPTISGSGPNGAIVHYRVTDETNRKIAPGELFLVDSGAQYEDGTTDVTRTVAVGAPTAEMRDRFTRVLKGHIAIARTVFPDSTIGAQLDSFARRSLWDAGLDFDHGTGHGVGSYLSVHEGPARIAKAGTASLRCGMILSNEPGYYKAGAYGIRTENLMLVVKAPPVPDAERPLCQFDTLTLVPIDRRLIEPRLLSADEREWLDNYHAQVAEALVPLLDGDAGAWLKAATQPLPHS